MLRVLLPFTLRFTRLAVVAMMLMVVAWNEAPRVEAKEGAKNRTDDPSRSRPTAHRLAAASRSLVLLLLFN
jgi:hypothetical protein